MFGKKSLVMPRAMLVVSSLTSKLKSLAAGKIVASTERKVSKKLSKRAKAARQSVQGDKWDVLQTFGDATAMCRNRRTGVLQVKRLRKPRDNERLLSVYAMRFFGLTN